MLVKQTGKYLLLFVTGGLLYNIIEILLRGWSHWTMFILGGVCFICLGLINELLPWTLPCGSRCFWEWRSLHILN